jgi:hypothetical protein
MHHSEIRMSLRDALRSEPERRCVLWDDLGNHEFDACLIA